MDEIRNIHVSEKPDSVTVKETAKGDLYFEVKCYGDAEKDMDELISRAEATYLSLVNRLRGVRRDE